MPYLSRSYFVYMFMSIFLFQILAVRSSLSAVTEEATGQLTQRLIDSPMQNSGFDKDTTTTVSLRCQFVQKYCNFCVTITGLPRLLKIGNL